MQALIITGDKKFTGGHPRFDLQARSVEKLSVLYWGKGALLPNVPQEHFDVVTSQDPFWRGLFAWFTARRKGAKFNVQVHADLQAQSFFRHILAGIILRHADSIRVVSEKLKKQVFAMGIKKQIHVLPVFVDLAKFHSVMRRLHPRPTILWLGRFEEEKNPLEAISVLEKVRKAKIDAQLIMLGEGSMKEKIIERANNHSAIQVLAWQDPIVYFETADIVLSTSWHESWGASIIEALAAGIPVVASDVGIAKEAGAHVVPHDMLGDAVIDILKSGERGELRLRLIKDPKEWAEAWKKTLLAT